MAPEFTIRNDFPPVDYDQWIELAEASLNGASVRQKLVTHTYEGVDVQAVYTGHDQPGKDPNGYPGFYPFVRGWRALGAVPAGWDLCQEHAHPDLQVTNRAILDDLEGGVTSLLVKLDRAACSGFDPDDQGAPELAGRGGLAAYSVDDLDAALAEVDFSTVSTTLEAGAAFLTAAATLSALWQRRGVAPDQARGAFGADPLGVLARDGQLPVSSTRALTLMTELAKWTAENYRLVMAVSVDTSPYHHAGATAAQDIACATATGVEYLRTMTRAGMDVDAAARQILFRFSVGTHHFLSIAKLRAARRLWARVVEACGGSPTEGAMRIHARVSDRVLTQRDPYVNMLRNTVGVFSAGLGGAETITSIPFDHMAGLPDDFSRRIARNTLLILQEEAHLNRVIDPAGGSWFLDKFTGQIAEKGWSIFQEVERQGGMLVALESNWLAEQIDAAFAPRARDIAQRKQGITGVSEFPNIGEQRVVHPPPDAFVLRTAATQRLANSRCSNETLATLGATTEPVAWAVAAAARGASLGQLAQALGFHKERFEVTAFEPRSFAEPFEELRDASDDWQATHGQRPRVFLANMGPVSHHTARANYAKNFFEAGGFEVIGSDGFPDATAAAHAFASSHANIAVICSSDKLYPEVVPQVAPKLKAAGAELVVLAGKPGDNEPAWREVGVDRFIFISCDVLATLRDMLRAEGVLTS